MGRCLLSGARRLDVFFSLRYSALPSRSLSSHLTISPLSNRALPTPARNRLYNTMASADLPASVEALTLQSTSNVSKFPGCFPTLNPVDIYREHISEELGKIAEIDPAKIYPRLQWTNTLDKGDLALAVCNVISQCKQTIVSFWSFSSMNSPTTTRAHVQANEKLTPYCSCLGPCPPNQDQEP